MNAREVMRQVEVLPALPIVVARLAAALEDEDTCAAEFEEIIMSYPELTGNLLRIVHSPLHGSSRQAIPVKRAIAFLGLKLAFQMSAGLLLHRTVPGRLLGYEVGVEKLWQHSVAVAVISRQLGLAKGADSASVFTAGLLHDLGKVAIGSMLHAHGNLLTHLAWIQSRSQPEAEQVLLGTDHTEVGHFIAVEWHLPEAVEQAIHFHHQPEQVESHAHQVTVDCVHLADCLAHAIGCGSAIGGQPPTMSSRSVKRHGLSAKDFERVISETEIAIRQLNGLLNNF